MKSWDKTDPIDEWEKERIKRINYRFVWMLLLWVSKVSLIVLL
jgi:hypothetical protein